MQMLQVETRPLHLQAAIEGVNVGCSIPVIANQLYDNERKIAVALQTGMVLIFAFGRDRQVSGDGPVDCVFACRRAQLRNFKMHQDGTRFAVVTDAGDLFVWVEGDRGWQQQRAEEGTKIPEDRSPVWHNHDCLLIIDKDENFYRLRSVKPSPQECPPYWARMT